MLKSIRRHTGSAQALDRSSAGFAAPLKVFIAAPMSGFESDAEYLQVKDDIANFTAALNATASVDSVYFAGTSVSSAADYAPQQAALNSDIAALKRSDLFVLILPRKVYSSVLVEAGIAIGCNIPLWILVKNIGDLPYLLQQAENPHGTDVAPPIIIRDYPSPHFASAVADGLSSFGISIAAP